MFAVQPPASDEIGEVLTWDEIHARYPDEWILYVESGGPPHHYRFDRARVIAHGPRSKDLLAASGAITARFQHYGLVFTGRARKPPSIFLDLPRP